MQCTDFLCDFIDLTVFCFTVNVNTKREAMEQVRTKERSNVFSLNSAHRHNILLSTKTCPEETIQSYKMRQLPEYLTQKFLNFLTFLP